MKHTDLTDEITAAFFVSPRLTSLQYTAASKSSSLDSVAKALSSLQRLLKSDPKLGAILHTPTLAAKDKSSIVAELEKQSGSGAGQSATVKNFLATLAQNNRLGLLEGVCDKFEQLMGAHRGEMDLVITSATRLEDRVVKRLETAVAKSEYSQGKKVKVVTKVSSNIIFFDKAFSTYRSLS